MMRYARAGAAVLTVLILALSLSGILTVRGWGADVAIGTNTAYCGWYLPKWDFYCEHL